MRASPEKLARFNFTTKSHLEVRCGGIVEQIRFLDKVDLFCSHGPGGIHLRASRIRLESFDVVELGETGRGLPSIPPLSKVEVALVSHNALHVAEFGLALDEFERFIGLKKFHRIDRYKHLPFGRSLWPTR